MKIKRIQVKNIGPYVNENAFDFDVSDITKRMVLIGGKNGAGKTTLFNAIKICLYGCVAYGFESNNAKYFAEIEKIINANEKLQKIGEAEVVIDLLMDDGKYNHTYTFVRSWRVAGKKIAETFTVYKDGETLSETEKSDFESYLLQTLPPNLFRFYFFDGEKISDFVFNSSKNSDFKDAFLKLCSLDTMEIIRENFRRISRSKAKGAMTLSAEYDRCLEADNLIAQRVECAEDEYREISNEILIIDQRLASLEKAYAKGGGISKKEWRSMQDQIAKEDVRREGHHKWLKELANNVLPFIILRTQLEELKAQIALEHKAQVDANVKSTIDTPEIKSIISGVLSRANIELADDISEKAEKNRLIMKDCNTMIIICGQSDDGVSSNVLKQFEQFLIPRASCQLPLIIPIPSTGYAAEKIFYDPTFRAMPTYQLNKVVFQRLAQDLSPEDVADNIVNIIRVYRSEPNS